MTMTISKPDIPATKKQLWLLHLLTKEDTRNWNLTVKQASDKISELKGSSNHKPKTKVKNKPVKYELERKQAHNKYKDSIGYGLNLCDIEILKAYKTISKHYDDSISVGYHAIGLFPGGKKPYDISDSYESNGMVLIRPIFKHLRKDYKVPIEVYKNWIKSLPIIIENNKYNPFPESWNDKAMELAKQSDSYLSIIEMKGL